jgi:hypothetical protein
MDTVVTGDVRPASPESAKEIFNRRKDFLSAEDLGAKFPKLFKIPWDTPLLPTKGRLKYLWEAGFSIMYTPPGVTAEALCTATENKTGDGKKLFDDTDDDTVLCRQQDFFTTETTGPEDHWRIFSIQPVPSFGSRDYLDQTLVAVEIAAKFGVKPEIVARAKDEVLSQEKKIRRLMEDRQVEAAQHLMNLEANWRFCPNFAQQVLFLAAYERVNGIRLNNYAGVWTNSLSCNSRIVRCGPFGKHGISVDDIPTTVVIGYLQRFFSCDAADLAP